MGCWRVGGLLLSTAVNLGKGGWENCPAVSAQGAGWGDTNPLTASGYPTIQCSSDTDHQQLVQTLRVKSTALPAARSSAASHKPGGHLHMPLTSYDLGRPHNSSRLPHSLERLAELAVECGWDSTRGWRTSPRELMPAPIRPRSLARRGPRQARWLPRPLEESMTLASGEVLRPKPAVDTKAWP